ncbi:MAG: DnaJ domain-containing protein [Thermodesulfobacteriota bacterium]
MSRESITSENPEIISGTLDRISLPNLLISLQKSKKTGSMDIISSKYELTIYFDEGYPYFAAGGSGETLLGKILLNKNKITKYQYDKAAEEIKKNKNMRIGEILVSLGMITPHELNDYLELQLNEKILESFLYLDGSYKFEESNGIENSIFYSKINTPELIHDGIQRFVKGSDVELEVLNIEFNEDLIEKTTNIGLGPKELRLIQLINQNKSFTDIEKSGQFKKDEILRVVFLLGLYEIAKINNFSINNFLLDEFKKFTVMNPLPELTNSNYTVKESELTDPTGEVLLLDDELEATAEREKLELRNLDDAETENPQEIAEENFEIEEQETKTPDERFTEEIEEQAVKNDDSDSPDIAEEEDFEEEEDEDVNILDAVENFKFQEEYEGDQEGVEVKSSRKKISETKSNNAQEKVKDVEITNDDLDEQPVNEGSKGNDKEELTAEPESIDEQGASEEEIKIDLPETGEGQPVSDYEIKNDKPDTSEQTVAADNSAVVKELEEFFDFIQNEENYYEILRVVDSATSEEIKDSYYQLIKKFHPDANSSFPEDIRTKSEQIFTKVTKAYEILLDEQKRIEYDERDELNHIKGKANSIYEAELIYIEGEMMLRQRNYKEAEKKFFNAIELNPEESAYIGAYAWARYLAAPDKERVLDDVKKELNKAIEMDPKVEQNYYYLGSVYKFSENYTRAEKNFTKAIEIDQNYIEAKRELRLIQNRKNQKGKLKDSDKKIEKKFWSGLFKK